MNLKKLQICKLFLMFTQTPQSRKLLSTTTKTNIFTFKNTALQTVVIVYIMFTIIIQFFHQHQQQKTKF